MLHGDVDLSLGRALVIIIEEENVILLVEDTKEADLCPVLNEEDTIFEPAEEEHAQHTDG